MPFSGKQMMKLFEEEGWVKTRQKGDHKIYQKEGQHVSIPDHKELSTGLEKALLKMLPDQKSKKVERSERRRKKKKS